MIFEKELKELIPILNELKSTNSIKEKENILLNYKDNNILNKVLYYTYNPYMAYGITIKTITNASKNNEKSKWNNVFDMLDELSASNINNELRKQVNYFLSNIEDKDLFDLIVGMLTKNLKIKCTAKTINKVWKDLIPVFDVMLAEKYFDKPERVDGTRKFIITIKLDGMRCVIIKDENGRVEVRSRQGQLIEGLVEFEEDFKKLPCEYVLDGELLFDKTKQDNINIHSKDLYSLTMKEARKKGEKHNLIFNAFDMLSLEDFKRGICEVDCLNRKADLYWLCCCDYKFTNIVEVRPLYIGYDTDKIQELLDEQTSKGEEGIMINFADAPYECKRTANILKVKKMQSCDLEIIGFEEGDGELEGTLGAIIVDYKGNPTKVGSGYTLQEREFFWSKKEELIGRIIEVQYFEESKNSKTKIPSLRFPIYKCLRENGKEVSYY